MTSTHRSASIDPLCHREESPHLDSLGMTETGGHLSDDAIHQSLASRNRLRAGRRPNDATPA